MRRTFVMWIAFATISIVFAVPSVLAEPICLDRSFVLVTTNEAAALDSSIGSVDVNGDGYVCRRDSANSVGTVTQEFMDDVDGSSGNFVCPPSSAGFTTLSVGMTELGLIDRNGNGQVCQKYVNCDMTSMMSKQCKVIVIDDHPAPP